MTDKPAFKKIIRDVVREEVTPVIGQQLISFEEKILKYFETFRSDMVKLKGEIVKELETARQEQTILAGKADQINDIETEVEQLKAIHPKFTHASV